MNQSLSKEKIKFVENPRRVFGPEIRESKMGDFSR